MKAVICTKYGQPEVLTIEHIEKPVPKDNELLVKIISTSVNSGDVRVRGLAVDGFMKIIMRFVIGFTRPRQPILGTVFSGVIEQVGKKVEGFRIGNEVFGITGFKFGTYAEYITVPETGNVILMPKNASFDEAAALPFGGQTAYYFLKKSGIDKRNNSKILIIGATGAVGTAAVQIAKIYNADITAVCSSNNEGLVKSLGVNKSLFYDKQDITKTNEVYDIIFDAVGKTSKKQCKHLLTKNGVYKTVGGLEYATETKEQLIFLKQHFEAGNYKAVIDRTYPMEKVVEAHTYVDTGRKKGNVVLRINTSHQPG